MSIAVTQTPMGPNNDNTLEDGVHRAVLVTGRADFETVTDKIAGVWEAPRPPTAWYVAFAVSVVMLMVFGAMITYQLFTGVGVWGNNIPVAWGFGIVDFVFWVGIGHAGTLISAILFLFRQKWRTGINRFSEAMTIFAVMCAGIFPAIHVGRAWFDYWLFPIPDVMRLWPNFFSPLVWDCFAVGTYFTVSLLFWYMGMVPDLATFRDRAATRVKHTIYGILAMGWRGANRHWHRYERAYIILAALATPLVLSVHSTVSFDFAVSQVPGWHTTIFPPYFVAGAIYGGFAMVVFLAVPCRELFGLKDFITQRHIDNMCRIMTVTGTMVGYAYLMEFFMAYYSSDTFERFTFLNREFGPYYWCGWSLLICNMIAPQFFWFKWVRTNPWTVMFICLLANFGMWMERYVIFVVSMHRDFLPSSWGMFTPTWVDLATLAGSFGLFCTLFLLFVRYLPTIAMAEVKSVLPQAHAGHATGASGYAGEGELEPHGAR